MHGQVPHKLLLQVLVLLEGQMLIALILKYILVPQEAILFDCALPIQVYGKLGKVMNPMGLLYRSEHSFLVANIYFPAH